MRVLITNESLAEAGGTQAWVRDFALALRARGHVPIAYTWREGAIADALRADGVPVATRLRDTGPAPDIVHGHHPQAVAALARHAASPGVFVAHSYSWWMEMPPLLPRLYRYVGVDEPCRQRLVALGAPPERTRVILNSVDLARFAPRDALPKRPRRALLFSNYAWEETYLPVVREACARAGLALDVAGLGCGNPVARPEEILRRYDIVFAKARCALEALATGCSVILCDGWGVGSVVRAADVDRMRPLNFGRKLLDRPMSAANLLAEIDRYDAADAADASRRVRAVAGLEAMVDAFLGLYDEVLAEHARTPARAWLERRALAAYAMRVPAAGALALTPIRAWVRNGAPRSALLASLLSARRRVLHRLGRPGYGGAAPRGFVTGRGTLRAYVAYFDGSQRAAGLALLAAAAQPAALLPIPWLAKRAFDRLIPAGDVLGLLGTGGAILGLTLVQAGLALAARRLTLDVTKRATARIREDLVAKFCALPRNFLTTADRAALQTRAVDDTERADAMTNAFVAMLVPAALVSGALGLVLLSLSPLLFVLTLLFLPAVWLTSRILGVRLRHAVAAFRSVFELFSRGILFVLQKQDLIHAQGAEEQEMKAQSARIHLLRETSGRMAWLSTAYALLHGFLFAAAGAVVLSVGGVEVVRGRMTIGTLASFFVTLGLLRAQMVVVSTSLPLIVGGRASLEAVLDLLRLPSSAPARALPPLNFAGRLTLEEVTYGYDRALAPVLRGVSLDLSPGEAVALVGRNGAGKTTLLNLVLGFDEPWSGRLLADGTPYGSFDLASMRRRTGAVLQDPLVVRGTLAENLAYGTPGASPERVAEAARLAGLDGLLAGLPAGWETQLGDEGGTLSGGARQRIAIARAILRRPALLLLDEPTAHLDLPTVESILGALRAALPDATLLVVTHDGAVARQCDRVLTLEDGRIAVPRNGPAERA